jgi:hypothetical protein
LSCDKSPVKTDGATIYVPPGTRTELAISDFYRLHNMKFTSILIQDRSEIQRAFLSGRSDALSTYASALVTVRLCHGPKAGGLLLLPSTLAKESLGVMVRESVDMWFDILIAAGTPVTERAPHRSVKAEFPHPAPTLDVRRGGVETAWDGISKAWGASVPPACAAAATPCGPFGWAAAGAPPKLDNVMSVCRERAGVCGDGVIGEKAPNHRPEPRALFRYALVPSATKIEPRPGDLCGCFPGMRNGFVGPD